MTDRGRTDPQAGSRLRLECRGTCLATCPAHARVDKSLAALRGYGKVRGFGTVRQSDSFQEVPVTRVIRINDAAELRVLDTAWDELSGGCPFVGPLWMQAWWKHYQLESPRELCVLVVLDDEQQVLGLAPLFMEKTAQFGTVLRFLGWGEVCSDYLRILARDGQQERVARAVATYLSEHDAGLTHHTRGPTQGWNAMDFSGLDSADRTWQHFATAMESYGYKIRQRACGRAWRLTLPPTLDAYYKSLSKTLKLTLRKFDRDLLQTGKAVLKTVTNQEEFTHGWNLFVDLHQRRRQSLGQEGCFSKPRFTAFLKEVATSALAQGRLGLHWLEYEGRPIAAECGLLGGMWAHAYQTGIETDALDLHPGKICNLAIFKHYQAQGFLGIDYLRGDEEYKSKFRCQPRELWEMVIFGRGLSARLRGLFWTGVEQGKVMLRAGRNPERTWRVWNPGMQLVPSTSVQMPEATVGFNQVMAN